jgi:hypothetical protein
VDIEDVPTFDQADPILILLERLWQDICHEIAAHQISPSIQCVTGFSTESRTRAVEALFA